MNNKFEKINFFLIQNFQNQTKFNLKHELFRLASFVTTDVSFSSLFLSLFCYCIFLSLSLLFFLFLFSLYLFYPPFSRRGMLVSYSLLGLYVCLSFIGVIVFLCLFVFLPLCISLPPSVKPCLSEQVKFSLNKKESSTYIYLLFLAFYTVS